MSKRILIVNTLEGTEVPEHIAFLARKREDVELTVFNTAGMKISPCLGCNYCWLKTPGKCAIKDDYEPILKELIKADQMWVISSSSFGFLSHEAKNIYDRIMPMLQMYLEFRKGIMGHKLRYDQRTDIGLIYTGEGNREYLERWLGRVAGNIDSKPLGVFNLDELKKAVSCM